MQQPSNRSQAFVALLLLIGIVFAAYYILTMPDRRSTVDKVGDAASELSNGARSAGRELENRTPAEKIGDKLKNVTHQ